MRLFMARQPLRHANGKYVLTATRTLRHSGHECIAAELLATSIDSLSVVPAEVRRDMEIAVRHGQRGIDCLRRQIAERYSLDLDRQTFANLVKSYKSNLGCQDAQADFDALVPWLLQEIREQGAIGAVDMNGALVSAIFYMSAEMVHHGRRNSQLIMMDTTFNTNRFGWPLCLICGVDEHHHTVLLAVALVHHQTTAAFEWILQQLRAGMQDEAWDGVACVFTDGDQAMAAALASAMPHTQHLRCRYHLKQNLRARLFKDGRDFAVIDQWVADWEAAARLDSEVAFNAAIAKLLGTGHNMSRDPVMIAYFTDTFPPGRTYADFALNHITTLGSRTTARVESWNATLKGMLAVDNRTTLAVLFETMRYAMSDKDYRAHKQAMQHAAQQPANTKAGTIDVQIAPHLTYYAQCLVKSQSALFPNYKYEMVQAFFPSIYTVHDRCSTEPESVRTVTMDETSMHCTCGYPITYLLPCRHLLVVNNWVYNSQFRVGQVGKRWLRAYKPAAGKQVPPAPHESASETAVPMFSSSVAPAASPPSRPAAWGTLSAWCNTICSIGMQSAMYRYVAAKLEALCADVEAQVSQVSTLVRKRPAAAVSADSASAGSTELNPTVAVDVMEMPPHRKRRQGSASEKRQQSAVERASKGMRVPAWSADLSPCVSGADILRDKKKSFDIAHFRFALDLDHRILLATVLVAPCVSSRSDLIALSLSIAQSGGITYLAKRRMDKPFSPSTDGVLNGLLRESQP